MNGPNRKDPYSHSVIQRLSPAIRASLTLAQRTAIEEALMGGQASKGHLVDLRLQIPLFFGRYYVVFLVGRDRRVSTQREEARRLKTLSVSSILFFVFFLLSPVAGLVLLILYAIKTALGIDVMPDWHFKDLLQLW